VGAIAGIAIAIGVVIYLTWRKRHRRRLAEAAAQGHYLQQPQPPPNFVPQPPPNFVTQPIYQAPSMPWAQPTQVLPKSNRIPSYYADNSSAANMISWQNQQQPQSEFSQPPSTTARSEYNSTYGGSSDYHAQPWTTATSTPRLGVHTPWTEGLDASESHSSKMSDTGLGRQNTKARYLTATRQEEVTWDAKRTEAQTVGPSRVGVSNMDNGTITSTAPVNTPSNSGSAGWAANDHRPTDPTVPGGVSDLPPPAYSEYQPHDGPQTL